MAPPRFLDYSQLMITLFIKAKPIGFLAGAMLLAMLAEPAGNVYGQAVAVQPEMQPPPVQTPVGQPPAVQPGMQPPSVPPTVVQPPAAGTPAVVPDDYVYYPNYGVYYNSRRHLYHYLRGDTWVTQPAPEGVTVDALQASPSVNMEFHDSPALHHAEMLKRYPRDWKPAAPQEHREGAPESIKR